MRRQQVTTARKAAVWVGAISLLGIGNVHAQSAVGTNTIVFVCQHGSAKSVVAAAHFNRLAARNHLRYRAVARGLAPDDALPPAVRAGLLSDGLNPTVWVPKAITKPEIQHAAQVITLGTELTDPPPRAKVVQWSDIPSVNDSYAAARAAIMVRLQELIASLSAAQKT